MARPPKRDKTVYFVGAGLSCALGLPNTPGLLDAILDLSKRPAHWLHREQLSKRLEQAFDYFYPDARHEGFRPDVVDFFSTLRTYLDVGSGLPGGFEDAPLLYRSLKKAIGHLLIERVRQIDQQLQRVGHPYLDEVVRPGNVAITSNWDSLIERYAQIKGVPTRFSGYADGELAILKLHGSVDWCLARDRKPGYADSEYAMLTERMFAAYSPRVPLSVSDAERTVVRVRALENWNSGWNRIRSRATELLMVTMARGKSGDLGPLRDVWRDAYGAVSRAKRLEIVGYSLPPDDVEIRTLLRAGIKRDKRRPKVAVRNPSPDVHERARRYLHHEIESIYSPVNSIA